MIVKSFKNTDMRSLHKWMHKHNMQPLLDGPPSLTGFIVPGVACAFIIKTEGKVCLMESLITNPHASSAARHKALDALFTCIKQASVELGYEGVIGYTTSDSTLVRAMNHGFKPQPHILLAYKE